MAITKPISRVLIKPPSLKTNGATAPAVPKTKGNKNKGFRDAADPRATPFTSQSIKFIGRQTNDMALCFEVQLFYLKAVLLSRGRLCWFPKNSMPGSGSV